MGVIFSQVSPNIPQQVADSFMCTPALSGLQVHCDTLTLIYSPTNAFYRLKICQIGLLHDPVTWYGINYAGMQVTQWEFRNKGTRTSPARLSFVYKVPLCNLRPSIIYSVPFTG